MNAPNIPSPSPSTSTSGASASTGHDPLLEQYLGAYKNETYANTTWVVKAWDVSWSNNTTARVQSTVLETDSNITFITNETLIVFPTVQGATLYFDTINRVNYSLVSTDPSNAVIYKNATGRTPTLYRDYIYSEGSPSNLVTFRIHELQQQDTLVILTTRRNLGP